MNKNILIVGPARVGKTTLARKLNKELGYSLISLDSIICSFEKTFPELGIKHDGNDDEIALNFSSFLVNYLNELSEGSAFYGGNNFVIEGTHIDFEKVIPKIDQEKTLILGMTYSKLSIEEMYKNIKEYDTEDEWTYWCSDEELMGNVKYFLERNIYFDKKFKEYNILAFDCSIDREKVIQDILEYIKEENSKKKGM